MKSYLRDRFCTTIIENNVSNLEKITFEVPQGSYLGPFIFLMYINSITTLKLNGQLILFADDTAFDSKR